MARELQAMSQEVKEGLAQGLDAEARNLVRQGLMTIIDNLDGLLADARADHGESAGEAAS
jgi:hypothetical protein